MVLAMICALGATGQGVAISTDVDHQPDSSALLDLYSNDKGLLVPRLTSSEIQSIDDPADGLLVYNSIEQTLYLFSADKGKWISLCSGSDSISPFTCGVPFFDPRDSKRYNTVQIGTQCWFSENLNYGSYIPSATGQSNNQIPEKYCYLNLTANCVSYGGLYWWPEAMDYQTTEGARGLCPPGWHIPTDHEWYILEHYLDWYLNDPEEMGYRGTDCGAQLKETGTSYWNSPNYAYNSSGFSARGGGYEQQDIFYNGWFSDLLEYGYFWTSSDTTINSYDGALKREFFHESYQSGRGFGTATYPIMYAYSVRCLMDE